MNFLFEAGNREDTAGYNPSASLLFAHQQLREAANQHYQNQILPPSLVQAAANNKNHLHQQVLIFRRVFTLFAMQGFSDILEQWNNR